MMLESSFQHAWPTRIGRRSYGTTAMAPADAEVGSILSVFSIRERPLMRRRWFSRSVAICVLIALVLMVAGSYFADGIAGKLLSTTLSSEAKLEALRTFFDRWGPWAPLAYLGMVTIEVVIAPIPGAFLYLPGGLVFGGFWGGWLSLAGNVLGAGISCQLMRSLAGARLTTWFDAHKLQRVEQLIQRRGFGIIVLLRVNPLTSSDLVSYAAGLTRVRVSTVMLGTLVGMAPLCFAQAYLAESLFDSFPWLVWPLVLVCVVYVVVVSGAIWKLGARRDSD